MKTLKIIVFAAIALFCLASCSDEKKALAYVSEEVLPDSELTDFLIKNNNDLRAYLDSKKHKYTYLETDGGHIWRNWRIYLTEYAPLLFK